MDRGAWWAAVCGVARSRTRLSNFPFTFTHWRRQWQPTPVFLPGESQGWEPGGLPSMGSHRVGRAWSDLAATAAAAMYYYDFYFSSFLIPKRVIAKFKISLIKYNNSYRARIYGNKEFPYFMTMNTSKTLNLKIYHLKIINCLKHFVFYSLNCEYVFKVSI